MINKNNQLTFQIWIREAGPVGSNPITPTNLSNHLATTVGITDSALMGDLWEPVITGYHVPTNAPTHHFNNFNKLQQKIAFERTELLGFGAGRVAINPASNLIYNSDTNKNRCYSYVFFDALIRRPW